MPQIDIRLKSTADNSGFDSAKKGSEDLGKSVNSAGENFERGAAAGRTFSEAINGNASAIVNLGPAIKSLGVLLRTNIIGALITIGAIAANVLAPVVKGILGSKAAIETFRAASEAAKKSLYEMADTPLEKIKKSLDSADSSAKLFLATQKSLLETQTKIADNESELARVRIQNNEKMSESAKAAALAQLNAQDAARKSVLPAKQAELELTAQQLALYDKQNILTAAQNDLEQSGTAQKLKDYKAGLDYWARITELKVALLKSGAIEAALPSQENVRATQELLKQYTDLVALGRVVGIKPQDQYTKEGEADLQKKYEEAKAGRDAAQKAVEAQQSTKDAALDTYQRRRDEQAATAQSEKALAEAKAAADKKKAQEADRATAEDRKKAQAELDKLKADTEAAAQERSKTPAGYFYTDEERAALAEKQKALDKMGPATPTAPTAPAKPVKTTTYAPRTKGDKSPQPASAGQPDQLPDLASPINDATKAVESAAPALAEQLQPAVDASKEFAAKVPELKLDSAPLAEGIKASTSAIASLQQANAAAMTEMLNLARDQASKIATMTTQVNSLRLEVGQLRSQVRNAA